MHDPELLTQERKAAANIIRYRSGHLESCLLAEGRDLLLTSILLDTSCQCICTELSVCIVSAEP